MPARTAFLLPRLALVASLLPFVGAADGTKAPPPNVLVLYSHGRLLPANMEADRGLRETILGADPRVFLFDEFLDSARFPGPDHHLATRRYLREKYAARRPRVIVVGADDALRFLLQERSDLFPGVPVVHMGVSRAALRTLPELPTDVVGMPVSWDCGSTIQQALRWHPSARRVVIVVGSSEVDRRWEAVLRSELRGLEIPASVEFLAGLSADELKRRLGALGRESIVFTVGWFRDGAGREANPREAVTEMALASGAPIYVPFSTFMGTGVVGGYMPTFEAMGQSAGRLVNRLLAGEAPGSLSAPGVLPQTLNVDWRQLRRWGIRERDVPGDAVVLFREPSLFEQHRVAVPAVVALLLVQGALIGGLLLERRKRVRAEQDVQEKRFELAHASRLAVAGELTGSIAHEINQPLGAILSNADAAELILEAGGNRREELRAILADIRRDDLRASEVIRRLRAVLARHEVERAPFELNEAIQEAAGVLQSEARRRKVTLSLRPAPTAATVSGDRIQIQQVVTNLLLNAMDAVDGLPDDRRSIEVALGTNGRVARIDITDRGTGVAPEHLPKIFGSFFTTKRKGMGLGLSIARTLVEAHGGRIWAENGPGPGSVFRVELPLEKA